VKIKKIAHGMNVAPMLWALHENPQLWDEYPYRTNRPDSPHREVEDIWARCSEPYGVWNHEPHDSVWYPCAALLPIKLMVYDLMRYVEGDRLGAVLITKVRPGCSVKPHHDPGWHARHYDKYAIQVQSAPGQAFCFEGEQLVSKPGDVYWFDNAHTHWVTNESNQDRITVIACIRTEKGV
jgi:aspartyl/asparaginyl beta-hydroxylase (cupin superfamily)